MTYFFDNDGIGAGLVILVQNFSDLALFGPDIAGRVQALPVGPVWSSLDIAGQSRPV